MKITKRQLRRLINEMYPKEGVTLARLEQITMAHQNLIRDIEEMYMESGLTGDWDDELDSVSETFSELLFPLFRHAEGGSGAPER